MKGEIIAVGTELLLGNIVNTNAQYLSQKLAELGIDVYYHLVVGDNLSRVVDTVKNSLERSDLIITSGGLGPTNDDLTKEAVSKALGLELLPNNEAINRIKSYFESSGRKMPECNLKQGYVPEGGRIIENDNGTAPGIIIEKGGKTVIMLPGPPKELKPMFDKSVIPYLEKRTSSTIKSKILRVIGIGESAVEELLKNIFNEQSNPTIAPYAKDGEVHLRITAKTEETWIADKMIEDMEAKVREILKENIYGCDDETLEEVVVRMLLEKGKTLSIAESCTGGSVAGRLTEVPGVSESFLCGVVTYSNEAKMKLLKVSENTLKLHGAVSRETAEEMALGVRKLSGTDIGISITGIAGPSGGTEEKPVGLCYIGIAYNEKVEAYRFVFNGSRNKIRWNANTKVLDILRRILL